MAQNYPGPELEMDIIESAKYGKLNSLKFYLNELNIKLAHPLWLNYVIAEAIENGQLKIVEYLVNYYKINGIKIDYSDLLYKASIYNQLGIVNFLVNDGFDYLTKYDILHASKGAFVNYANPEISRYLDSIAREM